MTIEERKKTVERRVVLEPARKIEVDTGELREVTIISETGNRRVEERPIKREEYIPPIVQTREEKIPIWVVTDEQTGEEHEFVAEADAIRFVEVRR